MKKIKTLFAALLALFACLPNLHADDWVLGAAITIEDVTDGMEVAFEARSDNDNKNSYLDVALGSTVSWASGSTVPSSIIWILEQADTVNAVTGDVQYYLKNKSNNKYLAGDYTKSTNSRLSMVDNKTEASTFSLHYSNDGGSYGSVNYGSSGQVDWVGDASCITIVQIDASITNGRLFVANEFSKNICAFYEYQDTNVWSIRPYINLDNPRTKLENFINTLPSTVEDDFRYGTDPGYIAEETLYNDFYNTLSEAIEKLETMTEDECTTINDKLETLYNTLSNDSNVVQVKDGGYYYFFTAYSAFTDVDNGNFAIYAPHDTQSGILGWKAFDENDPKFIWQIKVSEVTEEDGTRYSIQNMGSGLYINRSTSKADSQPVEWSTAPDNASVLNLLNHAGQWNISDAYDWDNYPPRPFHMENHQTGAGTSGKIVLWDGAANSGSAWFIREVPQEQVAKLASMENKIKLTGYFAANKGLADNITEVKDALGYISSQEALDNYNKAEADVDTMLNYSADKTYTEAEYATAYETLKAAVEAFTANRDRVIPDGYYRIQLNHWFARFNDLNYYMNIVDDKPGWKRTPTATTNQIWKITHLEGTKYSVQNMGNGKYLGKAASNSYWVPMQFSDTPDIPQLIRPFEAMNGQFYFTNGVDTTYNYDDGMHYEGTASESALYYYNGRAVNGGTAWVLLPISDEEYASISATSAQTELEYTLAEKLKTAKRLYNRNTFYTRGEKIITSADQLYSNNSSVNEGTDLGALIDDNIDTWWNSAWDTESENATHYLRYMTNDEAGLPDSIQLYSVQRNNSTWHRTPSKMRVSVSNDAENWKELPALLEKGDMGSEDVSVFTTEPQYTLVTGVKGYKYIKFEFLAVQPHYIFNYHPVAEYSEVNLYPVTGIDTENSLTATTAYKSLSEALLAAVKAGQAEVDANTATQATIDKLQKAIDDFNYKEVVDSIVAMTRLNVTNFTAGTNVGEFPDEALDTYVTAAQAVLDEIDAGGVEMTGDKINEIGKTLTEAYNTLYATMVLPTEGTRYDLRNH